MRAGGVPGEGRIAAAAAHHLLDGVNPEAIVDEDGNYSADFGENKHFHRPEKLVIVLDKYDALRRRGGNSHEQAIARPAAAPQPTTHASATSTPSSTRC